MRKTYLRTSRTECIETATPDHLFLGGRPSRHRLCAEDVFEIEPLLTFKNDKGQLEGVQYAQISTVLVNAVKEQQVQIDELKKQVGELKKLLNTSAVASPRGRSRGRR